jgi:MFS family permease
VTGNRRSPATSAPVRPRFSGWRVVVFSALALGMTGPGQTNGVSVFIDPMMAALDLTRSQVSIAYLVGTLAGAVAMPTVGRIFDTRGARFTMTLVAALFGAVLVAMAGVVGFVTLVLGFTGIRMLGQGGLSLVATTTVAPWFRRRRGLAIGITSAVGQSLLSSIPILGAAVIGWIDWRWAWVAFGIAVWVIVLPIARFGIIDHPRDVGQDVDGTPTREIPEGGDEAEVAFTRAQALRTAMFWAVCGAVAATGMIGTGLAFHQIDLLGEQGLTPVEAAANFLPQTAASLVATLAVGALVDRVAARWVLVLSMVLLAAAMLALPLVAPGVIAALYGMAVGAAGSSARALEAASFPKLYGVRHIGSIRGVVTSVSVASTAFGPLALSLGYDVTGSYVEVLRILLVIPVAVVVAALLAPVPTAPAGAVAEPDRRA